MDVFVRETSAVITLALSLPLTTKPTPVVPAFPFHCIMYYISGSGSYRGLGTALVNTFNYFFFRYGQNDIEGYPKLEKYSILEV